MPTRHRNTGGEPMIGTWNTIDKHGLTQHELNYSFPVREMLNTHFDLHVYKKNTYLKKACRKT